MLSVVAHREAFKLPRFSFKQLLRPTGGIYKRLVSAGQMSAALLIAAGMFVIAFGVHMPTSLFNGSRNAVQAIQSPPNKTAVVSNTEPNSCATNEKQTNTLFTACPTFFVDYSGQANGVVNGDYYNHYAGSPVANGEAQYYTNSTNNVRIENGSLMLIALNQPNHGYQYTSGRLDTHGKEDFLYGKIVVRAEIPDGIGTWPAIWMLPSQPKYASLSPASDTNRYQNDGELDIVESVGTQPHVVYGIAHSLAYPEDGVNRAYFNTVTIPNNNSAFHDYELDWTPTKLTFSVDGKPFFIYAKKPNANYKSWPFDQPFYLVMNLALGGQWGGTDTAQFPGDGVDKSALPAALKVQSIRYYSYSGAQ